MSIVQRQVCDRHQQDHELIDADHTRVVVLDGKAYEADMCQECSDELDEALAYFLAVARRVKSADTKRSKKQPSVAPAPVEESAPGLFYCTCHRGFETHRGLRRHIRVPPADASDIEHVDTYMGLGAA